MRRCWRARRACGAKELADIEGKAGERSQSMLVAQLLMCAAFMLFLGYPAGAMILAS